MIKIAFTGSARKDLRKLSSIDRASVIAKIKLLDYPFPEYLDIKRLKNTDSYFRLRVGQLRVIFVFSSESRTLIVRHIGYRGKIYRVL